MNTVKSKIYKRVVLGIIMLIGSLLAVVITPSKHISETLPSFDINKSVPKQFGNWKLDEKTIYQQVNAETQAAVNKIYTQLLTRTYINDQGYRVMLTIAYGADQSDDLGVHDPAGCYPAQGFKILDNHEELLHSKFGNIPVRRMNAASLNRTEPVTYWFTVGDHAVNNGWEKKKAQMLYSIKGEIPDGFLFRASSVDQDTDRAYKIQDQFINELIISLKSDFLKRVSGLQSR